MAKVELRDIVTEDDYEAVMGLRRGAGREGYLGMMIGHFEDAITYPQAMPRYWSIHDGDQLVGFVMISDNIPAATLEAEPDITGRYFLWRLSSTTGSRVTATALPRSTPSPPMSGRGREATSSGQAAPPAPARRRRSIGATVSSPWTGSSTASSSSDSTSRRRENDDPMIFDPDDATAPPSRASSRLC
jgi:hypothetical protein